MLRRCAPGLAVVVLLAGCGGGDAERPPAEVVSVRDEDSPPLRVMGEWVEALNRRDFERACQLSVTPDRRSCQELLDAVFAGYRGTVDVQGAYFSNGNPTGTPMSFSLSHAPEGLSAGSVERLEGRLLVHWEAEVIR